MTEKVSKRKQKKSENTEFAPTSEPGQLLWISAGELRRVIEIIAASEEISIQEAAQSVNELLAAKTLIIAPTFARLEVRP